MGDEMLLGSVARPQLRTGTVSAPRQPCAGSELCQEMLQNTPGASRRWRNRGLGGEWRTCHLLLGLKHSFRAQATCKQVWGRTGHSQKRTSMGQPVSKPPSLGLWQWNQIFSFKQG